MGERDESRTLPAVKTIRPFLRACVTIVPKSPVTWIPSIKPSPRMATTVLVSYQAVLSIDLVSS